MAAKLFRRECQKAKQFITLLTTYLLIITQLRYLEFAETLEPHVHLQ